MATRGCERGREGSREIPRNAGGLNWFVGGVDLVTSHSGGIRRNGRKTYGSILNGAY